MWYFTWIIGLGFVVLLGILSAMWLEVQDEADEKH
jgi:cyd operon protein YbgT